MLLALALTGCAHGRGWTRADTAAQVAFAAELALDAAQTMSTITPNCMEANPVIGECGEYVPVPLYMGAVLAVELVVARNLPPAARRWVEGFLLGLEGGVVVDNHMTLQGEYGGR